jgi:hypothetical protein
MKINYSRRWEQIQANLYDRDAFVASLPGNTRYLGNSEAPPGCPPGSTMNYVIIPKKGEPIAITSSLEEHRCRKESAGPAPLFLPSNVFLRSANELPSPGTKIIFVPASGSATQVITSTPSNILLSEQVKLSV